MQKTSNSAYSNVTFSQTVPFQLKACKMFSHCADLFISSCFLELGKFRSRSWNTAEKVFSDSPNSASLPSGAILWGNFTKAMVRSNVITSPRPLLASFSIAVLITAGVHSLRSFDDWHALKLATVTTGPGWFSILLKMLFSGSWRLLLLKIWKQNYRVLNDYV